MATLSCPRGHVGVRIVRGGTYGAGGHRRQLFVCRSPAGTHRFAEALPRAVLHAGAACEECLTELDPFEGPPFPRGYEFPARVIAKALLSVAQLTSYRAAAATARSRHRVKQGKRGVHAPYGANGTLVADWVETLAPVLWSAYGHSSWPEVLAVDELPFKGRSLPGSAPWPKVGKRAGGVDRFMILGGQGYPSRFSPEPWFLMAARSKSTDQWVEFYRSLAGRPEVIIGDAASYWQNAARRVWPKPSTPDLVISEFHLSRIIERNLTRLHIPAGDPIWTLAHDAFDDTGEWEALMTTFAGFGDYSASRFVTKYGVRIADQIARHPRPAQIPLSTGGLEQTFRRELTTRLADRRGVFTNRERLTRLLYLITLDLIGANDERAWTATIKAELIKSGGLPPKGRQILDPAGTASLWLSGKRG